MEIPEQVREAAVGLGTEIAYLHQRKGYAVYSVGMPHKKGVLTCPTGLPTVVIFKAGKARAVAGSEVFDWL
ncbi:MAG: hypothetical protein IJ761_00175 [Bacteroidales bacterium]|nr:hypothetical protein [Bacteroidales bacterium]